MRGRLIKLINEYTENITARELHSADFDEKFADFLLANAVVVPSCKVGDTVYQADTSGQIYTSTIKKVIYDVGHFAFDEDAIGETIFLTKEEIEQKQKGGVINE